MGGKEEKFATLAVGFFVFLAIHESSGINENCNLTLTEPGRVRVPELDPQRSEPRLACKIQIRTPPQRRQSVIHIQFRRLKLADLQPPEMRKCGHTSYMVIRDGVDGDLEQEFGQFCGELDQIYSYYSENANVDVLIAAEPFDDRIDYDFSVTWIDDKAKLPERFGPRPDIFKHVRGNLVAGTFCERVYQDCSRLQSCYVQSPGYPGIYQRNLRCRYYLSTKQPYIKLYVDQQMLQQPGRRRRPLFDVAGRDCDSLITCPYYGIGERECDKDYVKIYDGMDEYSPLIGTFCGFGSDFPSSIIGTGKELFLEFNTAREGAFVGGGFDLRVGHLPGNIHTYYKGKEKGACHQVFKSSTLSAAGKAEDIFLSLEHWYPADTNCTFLIVGNASEVVRLYFPSFKITSIKDPLRPDVKGDCRESLSIYDDSWPNPDRVIKTFCDGFSRPLEKIDFISSGPALFVSFLSATGSYSGSSLQFWAQYDFFDNRRDGRPTPHTACDSSFSPESARPWSFQSPKNTLVYKDAAETVRCRYDVSGRGRFGRVRMTVTPVNLKRPRRCGSEHVGKKCWRSDELDHIEVLDPENEHNGTLSCFANCWADEDDGGRGRKTTLSGGTGRKKLQYLSRGPRLSLVLSLNHKTSLLNYFKCVQPLFTAEYDFLHPRRICGPSVIETGGLAIAAATSSASSASTSSPPESDSGSGAIIFPANQDQVGHLIRELGTNGDEEHLTCVWDLKFPKQRKKRDVKFTVASFTFRSQLCEQVSLEVILPQNDGQLFHRQCASVGPSKVDGHSKPADGGDDADANTGVLIPLLKGSKDVPFDYVQIHFKMHVEEVGRFQLEWELV